MHCSYCSQNNQLTLKKVVSLSVRPLCQLQKDVYFLKRTVLRSSFQNLVVEFKQELMELLGIRWA